VAISIASWIPLRLVLLVWEWAAAGARTRALLLFQLRTSGCAGALRLVGCWSGGGEGGGGDVLGSSMHSYTTCRNGCTDRCGGRQSARGFASVLSERSVRFWCPCTLPILSFRSSGTVLVRHELDTGTFPTRRLGAASVSSGRMDPRVGTIGLHTRPPLGRRLARLFRSDKMRRHRARVQGWGPPHLGQKKLPGLPHPSVFLALPPNPTTFREGSRGRDHRLRGIEREGPG